MMSPQAGRPEARPLTGGGRLAPRRRAVSPNRRYVADEAGGDEEAHDEAKSETPKEEKEKKKSKIKLAQEASELQMHSAKMYVEAFDRQLKHDQQLKQLQQ